MSEVFKLCESCAHSGSPKFSGYCKACCFGSKFVQKGEEMIHIGTGNPYISDVKDIINKKFGVQSMHKDIDMLDAMSYAASYLDTDMALTSRNVPEIEKVIFNKPATIVFWKDGTKTVVKVQGKEKFNKEKGLAIAIAKKALGNQGNYYEEFKKWL